MCIVAQGQGVAIGVPVELLVGLLMLDNTEILILFK